MIHIKHRHRGTIPRRMKSAHNKAVKAGLFDTVEYFHFQLRDRRFTKAHASAAGYWIRKPGYMKQKRRRWGHDRPLEFSGETRDRVGRQYRLTSTSKRGRATYPGGRGFNRRHPSSPIDMREEFERTLPEEEMQFVSILDRRLDAAFE
ncbi:MAG: hypothetical protein AAFX06_21390 [Planctomycetota bacterium]